MHAYIYDAVRTVRGKAKPEGGLTDHSAHQLVGKLVAAIEQRRGGTGDAQGLILGTVGQLKSQGGNLALVSKLACGLADNAFAWTLNNYCVSGLTAICQATAQIQTGQAQSLLAGGVEMMSAVPFLADKADYYSDESFSPRTRFLPAALAADRLAEDEHITREEMDVQVLRSQLLAAEAEGTALQASRIVVNDLLVEECLRPVTAEQLANLPAAFAALAANYEGALEGRCLDHRHSVSHAPAMADGAALALIGGAALAGQAPRARILSWAESGGDPVASLTAGFQAMELALERADLRLDEIDRIEFMEAFAVTIAKFVRDYRPDLERLNVGGGHLAKGHPLGASGAILLSALLDALDACRGRFGLVVATAASGIGCAMVVERLEE
ncbi:TPA: hypothetical protein NI674_006638 [Pseudomonas aeruginosa]|uniref:thiolase family protein n=1 Tax=Pseudomonas aeruginosa group TaxID=136841 RepID=UPI0012D9275E|nr:MULTISPECIES: acyl-CoA thiolase [Pseudomonas aeruginosa group]MBH9459179.1 hypothetical protein [Pseudomonas aeruginosa]MBH9465981.1 hypothetical protein [Pseudomonas aeruginosa]MUI47066.1 acyl-CoA thiolase [Pseudomonas aeruginosa]QPZ62076.1 hypothetical protein I9X26_12010 [Pseudomonas aeruginosa]HCF0993046.1 hypothetical protein [Pseudomonas aeruginosa]